MVETTPAAKSKLLGFCLLGGGGAVALYSGYGLGGAFGGLANRAPLIELSAIDATGLLAAIGVILIGIVALLPVGLPEPTKRGRSLPKIPPAAKPLMIAAAIFIVASPIAASVVRTIVSSKAEDGGYVRCPRTEWPRKQPDRWSQAPAGLAGCPKGDAAR
ncbi:hypothetical protein [Polymorphobacter megasporae]|uniref:hypothetical protein n=1 Tax=Glacieibacterium megasporae TaxID=2835787 RepID=UPI001C1E6BE2|nr:hypothetical protein [Polymorphobacter megasporae]UAJ09127.1 hypothetical protein KTC28_12310 [Polymorphobacter megasporae]